MGQLKTILKRKCKNINNLRIFVQNLKATAIYSLTSYVRAAK